MYIPLHHAIFLFIIFSFLGWILEFTYRALANRNLVNPGVLLGPYVPIYGSGALMLIILYSQIAHMDIFYRAGIYFLAISVMEYITGEILLLVFKRRYWDYTDDVLNIRGHVCLPFSIYWVILALVFEKTFYPLSVHLVQQISYAHILLVNTLLVSILFIDLSMLTGYPQKMFRQAAVHISRHFNLDFPDFQKVLLSVQSRLPGIPEEVTSYLTDTQLHVLFKKIYDRFNNE
ncbi:MAG: putative ABC transporter permease [Spirochaetota bacterium]